MEGKHREKGITSIGTQKVRKGKKSLAPLELSPTIGGKRSEPILTED